MEELQARHRKEQRDLQARITQKKKSATKKTRKGVNDECATLERELKERQAQEVAALLSPTGHEDGSTAEPQPSEDNTPAADGTAEIAAKDAESTDLPSALQSLSVSSPASETPTNGAPVSGARKPNRQKARLARRAAEQEAAAQQAEAEAANLPDLRAQERKKMLALLQQHGLVEKEIRADGHCLYSAVADQMGAAGLGLRPRVGVTVIDGDAGEEKGEEDGAPEYKRTRRAAAEFMRSNPDDFAPFLEEPLEGYLRKVRDTGEWGGHLELLALARAYGVKINVLHADGRIDTIEPGTGVKEEKVIWLAYYKHGFGLGEHYNSLRKAP